MFVLVIQSGKLSYSFRRYLASNMTKLENTIYARVMPKKEKDKIVKRIMDGGEFARVVYEDNNKRGFSVFAPGVQVETLEMCGVIFQSIKGSQMANAKAKYESHGPGSSLYQHIDDVAFAAMNTNEALVLAAHDLGKAWSIWQGWCHGGFSSGNCMEYWRENGGKVNRNYYNHAAVGALIVFAIFYLRGKKFSVDTNGRNENWKWAFIGLHVCIAHHWRIQSLGKSNKEAKTTRLSEANLDWELVKDDSMFIDFCVSYLPSRRLARPEEVMDAIDFLNKNLPNEGLFKSKKLSARDWNKYIANIDSDKRLSLYLDSRDLLARLALHDQQSAALAKRRNDDESVLVPWHSFFNTSFVPRSKYVFPIDKEDKLVPLKEETLEKTKNLIEQDADFYFIPAPTGLGKTNAMLTLADSLVEKYNFSGVTYHAPTVAINDQTFKFLEDGGCEDLQIWNYFRQERSVEESVFDLQHDKVDSFIADNAFACSYNVTTFNQLMYALFNSHRKFCLKSLALRNKVIILDEFHKFPFALLPFVFRILGDYCRRYNCKVIFGSATPISTDGLIPDYIRVATLDDQIVRKIYEDPLIDGRREYKFIGKLTVPEVADKVREINKGAENLLVVVNLVGEGSYQLLKEFHLTFEAYRRLEEFKAVTSGRAVLVLDGTVPRLLRKDYLLAVDAKIKESRRPDSDLCVTLISTQMIEVGVDLDFDRGLIDWHGLNATIQRGGRVNRKGRLKKALVEVFSLRAFSGKKLQQSCLTLDSMKYKMDRKLKIHGNLCDLARMFRSKEDSFFYSRRAKIRLFTDNDLIFEMEKIARNIQPSLVKISKDAYRVVLPPSPFGGMCFEKANYITDLFCDVDWGQVYVICKDEKEKDDLVARLHPSSRKGLTSEDRRKLMNEISGREIRVGTNELRYDIENNYNIQRVISFDESEEIFCWPK